MALLAALAAALPAEAVKCMAFSPSRCWFEAPSTEAPLVLPRCGLEACAFEQSALECPFFSSGTYSTVDADDCEPFMLVRFSRVLRV